MRLAELKEAAIRVLALCLKDAKLYYFRGPAVVMGVLLPFFMWLAFVAGRGSQPAACLPGLVALASFFASSAITPILMPWEARQRTLEMLLARPVTLRIMLAAAALASSAYGTLASLTPALLAALLGASPVDALLLAAGVALASICYSFMGLLFSAVPSDVPADAVMMSSAVKLPLAFVSGVFVPISRLPGYARPLSLASPLTYLADLVACAYGHPHLFSPLTDLTALLAFTAFFAASAAAANERTLEKRL